VRCSNEKTMILVVVGLLACGQNFAQELLVDPGMNLIGPNGQLGNTPNPPWVVKAQRGGNLAFDDGALPSLGLTSMVADRACSLRHSWAIPPGIPRLAILTLTFIRTFQARPA